MSINCCRALTIGGQELEGMSNISDAGLDEVSRRGHGHGDVAGQLGNGVSNALGPDGVTAVRIQGQTEVPAIDAMGCPAAVHARFFVNDDTCTGRVDGGMIEVKGAK